MAAITTTWAVLSTSLIGKIKIEKTAEVQWKVKKK